jgi:hypothetical protein
MQVIEPIAGEASIERYQAQTDRRGRTQSYTVWVQK